MSKTKTCKLDGDGSVCLEDILKSFNSSIREEHAWALCYQCAKFFDSIKNRKDVYMITKVSHVYLQNDGLIHEKTILCTDNSRKKLENEKDGVADLGLVIYSALSHGIDEDEERVMSEDIEQLIDDMVSQDSVNSNNTHLETDDEGIERDSEDSHNYLKFLDIIHRCEIHLGTLTKLQAEAHYKAVVRALVTEALELSTFLEKVAQGAINLPSNSSTKLSSLEKLNFSDWAKFWVQVMAELRMGVKLKKVDCVKAPIEYELTPYEILMKDIRSCKYTLRKIMVNGDVPSRITKDAHAIILEFIRSRPPLKKASDRKLPPAVHNLTPREQLMNSIRRGRKLKPIPHPRSIDMILKEPKKNDDQKPAARRLIKVDYSQFEDEDFDVSIGSPDSSNEPNLWTNETLDEACDSTLEAYDLATHTLQRSNSRKQTLEVNDSNCYSVPQSRPGSRQSCNSSENETMPMEPEMARAIQNELTSIQGWQDTMSLDDRLSLTLAEIVHIRTVLTKAELEALPVEASVRHNVEARKVCFLCLKTRFGIFGPWGHRCSLCKRTVCSRCCSKMNVPMEHFSSVPVVLLSPSIISTPDDDKLFNKCDDKPCSSRNSSGSNSLSNNISSNINNNSKNISLINGESNSTINNKFRTRAAKVGRAARVVDRLKNNHLVVCQDCKMLVLQIIKSARANRAAIRNKTLQSLTLNLSPVF